MKITTNEKYQEILEKYPATFKILNTGGKELNYIFPAMLPTVRFANEYGTKEFTDKLFAAHDKQVEYVLNDQKLYKEYKDTVKNYGDSSHTVLGSNLYARRKYVFDTIVRREYPDLVEEAKNEVNDRFFYQTDFKRLIQETASEFREINGIGTLFRMNRKYFILLLTNAQVVILDKEEELRKKADEKTLPIKKQVKKDLVRLGGKRKNEVGYFPLVSVKKDPKYSKEEILRKAKEKNLDFSEELYPEYEDAYREYEKYFNKIYDTVKDLEIISADYESPYSSSYKTIKTLEFCQSQLWDLEKQGTVISKVAKIMRNY